jgi:hypothetical protein
MTHIVCRALSCLFWEQGACSAEEIEYEPDTGCLTFQDIGDLDLDGAEDEDFWEEESDDELYEEEEDEGWEEEQEDWGDEEF